MNLALFIAKRISLKSERTFSKLVVRIAVLGIVLGIAVMILSVAVVKGFKTEIKEKVRGFNGDINLQKFDLNASSENSPFSLEKSVYADVKHHQSVSSIAAFANKPAIIKTNDEVEGVVFKGVDANYPLDYASSIISKGKFINFKQDNAANQIIVSETIASRLNIKVGDDFLMYFIGKSLRKRKFTIVGIFNTGIEEIDKTYVIGSLDLVKKINGWRKNEIGGYEIRLKDFENIESQAENIANLLPPDKRIFTIKELYPAIFEWLSLLDVNATVILILMLLVATINMISALLIMILERTNMIGLLKAFGETNWGIRKIFLYQAFYLIGWGLLIGNFLGIGLAYFQNTTHILTLDQTSYYMRFVPVQINFWDVFFINLGTLTICLLVLLFPSMLVSKISPIKAITFK